MINRENFIIGKSGVLFIFLSFLVFVPSEQMRTQVNTEKMRNYEADKGLTNSIGFGFGFLSGNSDQYRISTSYRLDWLTKKYYSFLIVNYERGESGGELFSDKGFIHARITRDITDHWIVETFTQKEFNKLISLNDRQLFGGGLRYEIRNIDTSQTRKYAFGLGSGFMYERESTSDQRDKKVLIRSTSYLSIRWQLDERVTFLSTAYLQLAVRKRSDFRVLDESTLSFEINKTLSLLTSFNLRYDNEPPPAVKNYDIAVTNGINVRF